MRTHVKRSLFREHGNSNNEATCQTKGVYNNREGMLSLSINLVKYNLNQILALIKPHLI